MTENTPADTKTILDSKTFWTNLAIALLTFLATYGNNLGGFGITNQTIVTIGLILSTLGNIILRQFTSVPVAPCQIWRKIWIHEK